MTPFLWMISNSFKDTSEIFSYPPTLWPQVPIVTNYIRLFTALRVSFGRNLFNSTVVAIVTTLATLLLSALGGFAFSKYEFKGKRMLFYILLGSMMLPFQAIVVPLYILMVRFGWVDNYRALIIPFVASPLGTFLMRQYMVTIPSAVIDAARVDGCSEFRIFAQIALPLSKPALGSLTIVTFMNSWNSFLWPLIVLSTDRLLTMPVALNNFVYLYQAEYGLVMAGATLAAAPVIAIFIRLQKYFVSGLTLGATKL